MADFLDGNYGDLSQTLTQLMQESSDKLAYEQAAVYRNFLHALDHMKERVLIGRFKDDYITTAMENTDKLKRLAEVIGLKKLPAHIEAFDNSHLFLPPLAPNQARPQPSTRFNSTGRRQKPNSRRPKRV